MRKPGPGTTPAGLVAANNTGQIDAETLAVQVDGTPSAWLSEGLTLRSSHR